MVLGIARVAGETAPLLILVGYSPDMNTNLFSGTQGTLPGMIYDQFINLNHATGATAYHLDANGNRVAGAAANFAPAGPTSPGPTASSVRSRDGCASSSTT